MRYARCLMSAAVLLISGCAGPIALKQALPDYDEAISQLQSQSLLLNIARARDGMPPHFTTTTTVAATFNYEIDASFVGNLQSSNSDILPTASLRLGANAAENPTIELVPKRGDQFATQLLTPLDDDKFTRADFAYDRERDLYICPGGKELKTSGTVHDGTTIEYIAKRSDCAICPLKPQCTTGRERRLQRDAHQDARDYTESLRKTEAYGVSSIERKRIETLFGEAKHILSMTRLGPRGLAGARDEFLLTATAQNLKRLARHSTIPPPQPSAA